MGISFAKRVSEVSLKDNAKRNKFEKRYSFKRFRICLYLFMLVTICKFDSADMLEMFFTRDYVRMVSTD